MRLFLAPLHHAFVHGHGVAETEQAFQHLLFALVALVQHRQRLVKAQGALLLLAQLAAQELVRVRRVVVVVRLVALEGAVHVLHCGLNPRFAGQILDAHRLQRGCKSFLFGISFCFWSTREKSIGNSLLRLALFSTLSSGETTSLTSPSTIAM